MYPHTIDNGHGERMTFLGVDGDRLCVDGDVDPGAGPPMHVHHLQSETITRRVRPHRLRDRRRAGPLRRPRRDRHFAPGVEHRFWNAGDDDLVAAPARSTRPTTSSTS